MHQRLICTKGYFLRRLTAFIGRALERIASAPTEMIGWIVYEAYPDVPKGIAADFPCNRVRLWLDDMVAMVGTAQAGLGVVRMSRFLGRASVGLVQVPVLPPQVYSDIRVVSILMCGHRGN